MYSPLRGPDQPRQRKPVAPASVLDVHVDGAYRGTIAFTSDPRKLLDTGVHALRAYGQVCTFSKQDGTWFASVHSHATYHSLRTR